MKKKSFSYLEVLLSIAIISLFLLFVSKNVLSSVSSTIYLKNRYMASKLLSEELWESIKLVKSSVIDRTKINRYSVEKKKGENPSFSISTTISRLKDYKDLYQIAIVAEWNEGIRKRRLKRFYYSRAEMY